jgi:dTDP-4-dehydrorhamnose reductase
MVIALQEAGHTVDVIEGRYEGDGSDYLSGIMGVNYDYVINCVGHGSIPEAEADPVGAYRLHVMLPIQLDQRFIYSKIINFSSGFCANSNYPTEPHYFNYDHNSKYIASKQALENLVRTSDHSVAIRVTNLYGKHRWDKCFPGKIEKNDVMQLPNNVIVPTPTDWLAKEVVSNLGHLMVGLVYNAAPLGSTTVVEWGKYIKADIYTNGLDHSRPRNCAIGYNMPNPINLTDWESLWLKFVLKNVSI